MSRRKAFLDAACKENVEDFLRFIELHVSGFLIINHTIKTKMVKANKSIIMQSILVQC